MSWIKKGRIFSVDHYNDWMVTHACVPTALYLPDSDRIRVYFAPRNARGQSIPTYLETLAEDPSEVVLVNDSPLLSLGKLGTFDDGGIMPCSLVKTESEALLLYYVGWNPSVSVSYRNAIGVAQSNDGGLSFQRLFPGAVVDRSATEPFFTASPEVMREGAVYHMWYASGTGFLKIDGRVEPLYEIKYASSTDGLNWNRTNHSCIPTKHDEEAVARPSVIKDGTTYRMWFCYRDSREYRDGKGAYRIGYAESEDAINWRRDDNKAGIDFSPRGWDSTMQTYPNVLDTPYGRYLFYNGNGFGRDGIGYAKWKT